MATVQQWGRKESIIWPPRGYVYTLGAFIFACILTGRLHLHSLSIRSFATPALLPSLLLADRDCRPDSSRQPIPIALCFGRRKGRAEQPWTADVQPGSTPQFGGKPLPLMLTTQRRRSMARFI